MLQTNVTVATCKMIHGILSKLSHGTYPKRVCDMIERGAYDQIPLMGSPIDNLRSYCDGDDSRDFACDYLAYNILRKFPFKGADRKSVALATFVAAEERCQVTNRRLMSDYLSKPEARTRIFWLREKIASVLGPFDWNLAQRDFAWGPGATTRLKHAEGDVYYKFRGKPETTLQNLPAARAAMKVVPRWVGLFDPDCETAFKVVPGSKITTVPKDAKTDRTIAIEPCMNMYIQKGIGSMIRNRLRRVGVDLNDQTVNQEAARRAWADGFATIDLSAASDSVAEVLVDLLLPEDWLSALKRCRSHRYVLNGKIHTFAKFSTMGNGYTFELESLLFWAITMMAIRDSKSIGSSVCIYGDDIIVPIRAVGDLVELLDYYGFSVNTQKSFAVGHFFESCGKHYFKGEDVTPVYVDAPVDHLHAKFWLLNSIARWSSQSILTHDVGAFTAWCHLFEELPDDSRRPIPKGVGDGGVVPFFNVKWHSAPTHITEWLAKSSAVNRRGPLVAGYQRGFAYTHFCELQRDSSARDPTDVPYLLRQLYRLDKRHLSAGLKDIVPERGLMSIGTDWKWKRGWSSSWEVYGV
jgi:hypothetical protein